jgi:hypothetical protein
MPVHPSKEELERVWNEEQPGWLKDFSKRTKKMKAFNVTLKPYTKQYLEPVSKVVYAKNAKQAEWERPYDEMRKKYPEHFEKSPHGNHYWMKPGITVEIRVSEVQDA